MWVVIDGIPYIDQVNDDIDYSSSLSDPNSTCDFTLDDPTSSIALRVGQEVVIWDENVTESSTSGTVATVPSMNYAIDPLCSTALDSIWATGGTNGGLFSLYAFGYKMTFSNSPVATGYVSQTTSFVRAGQKYNFAVYVNGTSPVNLRYFSQIDWLDSSGSVISSVTMTPATPTGSNVRFSISGVAPTGTMSATISFGGSAVNATNSGTINFGSVQFEPCWFEAQGVTYPTRDLNYSQVTSVLLPNGTTSRKCRIFAGEIGKSTKTYIGTQRFYALSCDSLEKLAEDLDLIAASYDDVYDTDIIEDVLSGDAFAGWLSSGQQNRFAPTSTLVQGSLVPSKTYTNSTFRELLNGLDDLSGSQHRIDPYGYVWYVPPSFSAQIIRLSDSPDNELTFAYQELHVDEDGVDLTNTALVQGDNQHASAITETFSGNGSTKIFNLSYPPATVTSVKIGSTDQRTGVAGVDQLGATFKALINKQKKTLEFGTAPTSGTNNVSITYTYEDPVVVKVIAGDALAEQDRQRIRLVNDSSLTSTTTATQRGLAQLSRDAFEHVNIALKLEDIFLPPGSLVLITCAGEGWIDKAFTIQSVSGESKARANITGIIRREPTIQRSSITFGMFTKQSNGQQQPAMCRLSVRSMWRSLIL